MNEYVNAAMVMIQKLIAVATPVAKQAYEISLLTLQIDTIQDVLTLLTGVIIGAILLGTLRRYVNTSKAEAAAHNIANTSYRQREWLYYTPLDMPGYVCIWLLCAIPSIIGLLGMLNIWLWVKLFRPELWLVHMAIEKLVK